LASLRRAAHGGRPAVDPKGRAEDSDERIVRDVRVRNA
jgi:hypothetical protein